jgi:hypothetical protein
VGSRNIRASNMGVCPVDWKHQAVDALVGLAVYVNQWVPALEPFVDLVAQSEAAVIAEQSRHQVRPGLCLKAVGHVSLVPRGCHRVPPRLGIVRRYKVRRQVERLIGTVTENLDGPSDGG